jgi:hypothetical protein
MFTEFMQSTQHLMKRLKAMCEKLRSTDLRQEDKFKLDNIIVQLTDSICRIEVFELSEDPIVNLGNIGNTLAIIFVSFPKEAEELSAEIQATLKTQMQIIVMQTHYMHAAQTLMQQVLQNYLAASEGHVDTKDVLCEILQANTDPNSMARIAPTPYSILVRLAKQCASFNDFMSKSHDLQTVMMTSVAAVAGRVDMSLTSVLASLDYGWTPVAVDFTDVHSAFMELFVMAERACLHMKRVLRDDRVSIHRAIDTALVLARVEVGFELSQGLRDLMVLIDYLFDSLPQAISTAGLLPLSKISIHRQLTNCYGQVGLFTQMRDVLLTLHTFLAQVYSSDGVIMDANQMHVCCESYLTASTALFEHQDHYAYLAIMVQRYISFDRILNDKASVNLSSCGLRVHEDIQSQWRHWELVEAAPRAKQRLGSPKNNPAEVHGEQEGVAFEMRPLTPVSVMVATY